MMFFNNPSMEYKFCLYLKISLKLITFLTSDFCYLNIIKNLEQITNIYKGKMENFPRQVNHIGG